MKRYYLIEFTYDGYQTCICVKHHIYTDINIALSALIGGSKDAFESKSVKEINEISKIGCSDTYHDGEHFKIVAVADYIEKSKSWKDKATHNLIDMVCGVILKEERGYKIDELVD